MDPNEIKELTEVALKAEAERLERRRQEVVAKRKKAEDDLKIEDEQKILKEEAERDGWKFSTFFDELTTKILSCLREAARAGYMGVRIDAHPANGESPDLQRICKLFYCDGGDHNEDPQTENVIIPRDILAAVMTRLAEWADNGGLEAYNYGWSGVHVFLKRPEDPVLAERLKTMSVCACRTW